MGMVAATDVATVFGAGFGVGIGFGSDARVGVALEAVSDAAWGAALTAGFEVGSDAAVWAGSGAAGGAGLDAGVSRGAAFWAGAGGLPRGSSAKAGAKQVISAKANTISRTFAVCCDSIAAMIGLLSNLSNYFHARTITSSCCSTYKRRHFNGR